jgi:hypothetical protein
MPTKTFIRILAALLFLAALLPGCSSEPEPKVEPDNLFAPHARKKTVLLVGDSLSISLANQLRDAYKGQKALYFAHLGRVSSGLTRPELIDWPKALADLSRREKPDAVVIMIGANDEKSLPGPDGGSVPFESAAWDKAYSRAVAEFLDIARSGNPDAALYWVGAPVMSDPALAAAMRRINAIIATTCARKNARFIDVASLFSDKLGGFARYAVDEDGDIRSIRYPDGVHLSVSGAKMLAGQVLNSLDKQYRPPLNAAGRELHRACETFRPVTPETAQRLLAAIHDSAAHE